MAEARVVLIAGPTASGKSELALSLAEEFGGTVINADSMQVYRDLRVVTARPPSEDEGRVPHTLYGMVDGADAYSVARFAGDAAAAIAAARAVGRLPIVVGGTGLYFRALLQGLSPVPPIADDLRRFWREEALIRGAAELHEALKRRDPIMAARLSPSDTQRIVRALEVIDATQRSLAQWQEAAGDPIVEPENAIRLLLAPPRKVLHARIASRCEAMMDAGAAHEVAALVARRLDPGSPVMRAVGIRPLMQLNSGAVELADAVQLWVNQTRQYVRRQETWFRRNMISWTTSSMVNNDENHSLAASIVRARLDEGLAQF